jgi:hypothetical protein
VPVHLSSCVKLTLFWKKKGAPIDLSLILSCIALPKSLLLSILLKLLPPKLFFFVYSVLSMSGNSEVEFFEGKNIFDNTISKISMY